MSKFLITIDTEGDNLWEWKSGDKITTENVLYLSRFQEQCNRFRFKPTWLTNYEMIMDNNFVTFIKNVIENNQGEIGMHLHAWSTPPYHALPDEKGEAPYLIEYPETIMEEKIKTMTNVIYEKTGQIPVSHRAGRWATNNVYFRLLEKYGYRFDCSVTPHVDWRKVKGQTRESHGTNYKKCSEKPYFIGDILEIPMSIRNVHKSFSSGEGMLRKMVKNMYRSINANTIWLRPNGNNLSQMKYIIDRCVSEKVPYVMFMLHSSEMMPGGSPYFKNSNEIERLYNDITLLFEYASNHYEGATLKEFGEEYLQNMS